MASPPTVFLVVSLLITAAAAMHPTGTEFSTPPFATPHHRLHVAAIIAIALACAIVMDVNLEGINHS
jgi:hypothetical protein